VRIIAIDATRYPGAVATSVDTACLAAEAAGATVDRVRLVDLDVRYCTACGMCKLTGHCKISDDLPGLAERIAQADGVIVGTESYFRHADERTQALLDRIASYFPDSGQLRLPGMGPREIPYSPVARAARRAVIITACKAPEPLATFFGYTTGPVRELRSVLGHSGIRTIGSLSVTNTWRHPEVEDWERDKARSLGRILAGKI